MSRFDEKMVWQGGRVERLERHKDAGALMDWCLEVEMTIDEIEAFVWHTEFCRVDMSWLVSVTFLLVDWCAKVSVLCDRQLRSMGAILGILQQLGVFKRKGRELALGFECWAWRLPSKYLGIFNYIFFRQFQSFLHHTLWHSLVSWPCSVEMEHWQSRPLSHLLGLTWIIFQFLEYVRSIADTFPIAENGLQEVGVTWDSDVVDLQHAETLVTRQDSKIQVDMIKLIASNSI